MENFYRIKLTHDIDGIKYNSETIFNNGKPKHTIFVNFDTKDLNQRGTLIKVLKDFNNKGFNINKDLFTFFDNSINGIESECPLSIIINDNPVLYKMLTNIKAYKKFDWTAINVGLWCVELDYNVGYTLYKY